MHLCVRIYIYIYIYAHTHIHTHTYRVHVYIRYVYEYVSALLHTYPDNNHHRNPRRMQLGRLKAKVLMNESYPASLERPPSDYGKRNGC